MLLSINSIQGYTMSDTITVAEYCKRHNTSTQAVYARIKRGTLESTVVNGIKMVIDNIPTEVATDTNEIATLMQSIINDQKKEIKRLHRTIKQLEKQNIKSIDTMLKLFTNDTKQIGFDNADYIEAKEIKSKKDRRRDKKKYKNKKK